MCYSKTSNGSLKYFGEALAALQDTPKGRGHKDAKRRVQNAGVQCLKHQTIIPLFLWSGRERRSHHGSLEEDVPKADNEFRVFGELDEATKEAIKSDARDSDYPLD
ncbi:unnamed protein product [Linum trigynum]|uniref:Uncharacterized protein n=1 Tax=Linum trigynum TaxID=586398 RepID=A0AAV2FL44_9ROSI